MTNFPSTAYLRRVGYSLFFALVFANVASAQQPAPLAFAYSYNVFALDDTSSLVELDYQYSERGLAYQKVDGKTVGRLFLRFVIWDSTGQPLLVSSWITTSAPPQQGDEDHALLGVKLFGVRPGHHKAQILYEDAGNQSHRDSATFDLNVRTFAGGAITLSDVQVISEIAPSNDKTNRFYKNGYVIYPNVLSVIEPPFLLLNTYLEVNNAHTSPVSQYELSYAIADSTRKLIYQKDEQHDRPTASAIIDVHSIVVDELPSGNYYLVVKAFAGLRGTARDSSMVIRTFEIINPDKDSAMAQALASGGGSNSGTEMQVDPQYAGMTAEELDREFVRFKHLTIESDRPIWDKLDGAAAKARFLTEFWMKRDPNPGTAANELRDEYLVRIETVDKLYREPHGSSGSNTDRGRIYLKYGKPDEIERHYMDPNRKPYEVWYYSKDNEQVAFVDKSGIGKFVLVHSTITGEPKQDDWLTRFATVHENFDR